MKWYWSGFEYGPYYLYWWNWLPKAQRYWGRFDMYYDGPHCSFGFWFTNISWCAPWSKVDY